LVVFPTASKRSVISRTFSGCKNIVKILENDIK
jgi:hypothetical protein